MRPRIQELLYASSASASVTGVAALLEFQSSVPFPPPYLTRWFGLFPLPPPSQEPKAYQPPSCNISVDSASYFASAVNVDHAFAPIAAAVLKFFALALATAVAPELAISAGISSTRPSNVSTGSD